MDASDVIRDSLRRWKAQEEVGDSEPKWLEKELEEGVASPDAPGGARFWRELRRELHAEHKNGSRRG